MSLRTPTSICIQRAQYNSMGGIYNRWDAQNFRDKSALYVMSSIALELKQISSGLEVDINKLKQNSQVCIQHIGAGDPPCDGSVCLSNSKKEPSGRLSHLVEVTRLVLPTRNGKTAPSPDVGDITDLQASG